MDLSRTFYTPGRKKQQNKFLSLVQGKRGLYLALRSSSLGKGREKQRGLQQGIAGKPTKTGGKEKRRSREDNEIYTGGRSWESTSLTQRAGSIFPQPPTQLSPHRSWGSSIPSTLLGGRSLCLFPSSFVISLWDLGLLELGWHWLLLWLLTGGWHCQVLIAPPLILSYSNTQLGVRKLRARLRPPSQRPSAPLLLPPLFLLLLPLLYLHQLLKTFGCCWVYNKPILERQNRNIIRSEISRA